MDSLRPYKNKIVAIDFYDHVGSSQREGEALQCRVFGRLVRYTDIHLTVQTWECEDRADHNNDYCHIVRSAVEAIHPLHSAPRPATANTNIPAFED